MASCTASGSPSSQASDRATAACLPIMPSRSRTPDTANSNPTLKAVQQRLSPTDQPPHRPPARRTAQRLVVLGRLHRDVVAEPLGLLVRVGMAADVDQQRGVVDDRALLVVEADQIGRAHV